ncbi:hypothetical protein [Pseudomonas putida]|uniref:hypothetical protein n=1 Tax=Pseudomonas putida TaxID=303 RepID=UPI001F51F843|nr:hypothetical protein [Pseudomonas putida]MCI1038001.1 hypothetical protein [Pseudomonas putida]
MANVYALDQNYFRRDGLERVIAEDPKAKFVILDVAFLEMAKGEHWNKTMQGSLAKLARAPGRILGAISLPEALRHERQMLEHASLNLVCKDHTRYYRALATELASNDPDGPLLKQLAADLPAAQEDLKRDELNHEKNLCRLQEITQAVKHHLGAANLKLLKHPTCTNSERLSMVYFAATRIAQDLLIKEGHPPARIRRFLRGKPLLLRYQLALVRHAMEWAIKGGIENLTPEKATNDVIDQHYVVIGSFFDGLFSYDERVRVAYQELRLMLSIKNPLI